jgi:hypothetical protein
MMTAARHSKQEGTKGFRMNRTMCVIVCALALVGCQVEDAQDSLYYVRNDTTIDVSVRAVSTDTVLSFADIAPAQRVLVGKESLLEETELSFFLSSDSVQVMHGDTVLDTYLPSDTTRTRHIMARSDYVLTNTTDSYSEYEFGLFSH